MGITRNRLWVALLWLGTLSVPWSQAAAQPTVYVGTFLHDVSSFKMQSGTFEVDAEVWLKWRGDFDPSQLRLANASEVTRTELGEEHDLDWHSKRYRIRGTFRGHFPMHDFPFDSQKISIDVELPEEYGRLVPDLAASGMAEAFSVTDWSHVPEFEPTVQTHVVRSDLGIIAREGKATRLHQTRFAVSLNRPIITVALKLFLPLSIIILVAFIALFLSHEVIAPRASIGVTALLSCFAFQFTVADMVPTVGYLTFADTLFLIGYVFSCLALVATVVSHAFYRRGRLKESRRIDIATRVGLPILSLLAIVVTLPKPHAPLEDTVAPFPKTSTLPSSKDTLVVGVTMMPNLLGAVFNRGARLSLIGEHSSPQTQALLAERVPGVDNDALRFLANGELEVTWKLREGLRWSDGREVTADDLTFLWKASPSPHVKEVMAPDNRTLVVTWKEKVQEALQSPSLLPHAALNGFLDEGGYEAMHEQRRHAPTPGMGPYTIKSKSKDEATMERNPHYIGSKASIAKVTLKKYPSSEALTEAFLRHEVDITAVNAISMEDALRIQKTDPKSASITQSAIVVVLSPDLSHPLLKSLSARRAIMMALDRQALAQEVYGPEGRVAHVPVVGALPNNTRKYEFDREAAIKALSEFPLEERSLTLFASKSSTSQAMAQRIAEQLRLAGLQITVEYVKSVAKYYRTHSHGGLVLYPMMGRREASPQRFWNYPIVDGEYPTAYRSSAYDDAMAKLVERYKHSLYPERSEQLRDAMLAKTSERLPNLPLLFTVQRQAVAPSLVVTETAPDDHFGEGIHRWYFK